MYLALALSTSTGLAKRWKKPIAIAYKACLLLLRLLLLGYYPAHLLDD